LRPKLKSYFFGISTVLTGVFATGGCTTPQNYGSDGAPRFNYNSIEEFKQSLNNHIDEWALSVDGQAIECLEDFSSALSNNNLQSFNDYDLRIASNPCEAYPLIKTANEQGFQDTEIFALEQTFLRAINNSLR
jgi:hypothetical protein